MKFLIKIREPKLRREKRREEKTLAVSRLLSPSLPLLLAAFSLGVAVGHCDSTRLEPSLLSLGRYPRSIVGLS